MTQTRRIQLMIAFALVFIALGSYTLLAWEPVPVENDPLVRMPGTQPGQTTLEAANRCLNCHSNYDTAVEPGFNWKGSMMAQSARDFLFWACITVAGQDSIWAVGTPNAVDICERCHFPKGWLEGRSDPANASLMTGADYDGVQCDFCHTMYDPFFETTYAGTREGNDWHGYWDETNASGTPSQPAADATYAEDLAQAQAILKFDGTKFFSANNLPPANYTENGAGQYFVSPNGDKRASFADANGRHAMLYSRYHKSKYFCNACHDVSNPALANLGLSDLPDSGTGLITEQYSAANYFHVERTFSEFMLSDYGQQGGSAGIGPYAPGVFETSHPNNQIATCQDCHMPDGVGKASDMKDAVNRPADSVEHPNSGQPVHDLTGGNAWVSAVLASAVPGAPNYDATNDALLRQGPATLTLDLTQGQGIDPVALLAGAQRAKQQLLQAAAIQNLAYDSGSGALSFRVQNQTGHKLISGFPEGRRMFVNVKAYAGGTLIYEVNPYDPAAGTLKGLDYPYQPGMGLPDPQPLTAGEAHVDELVYEMKPSSSLTGEPKTFHFALADGRYKDNRIPPKGFRIEEAADRVSVPVWHGVEDETYFTAAEYAGGFDAVSLDIPAGADYVEVTLYYQTTSREYVEFLRDEINGTGNLTLTGTGAGGDPAYLIQTDPFFSQLKAWGDTIWNLWTHNLNLDGARPFEMAQASLGVVPPPAVQFTTEAQAVGESVGSVIIRVELGGTTGDTVIVPFTVSGTATGGGVDHNLAAGTFSIPPGSLTDDVTFQVTSDSRYEGPETVIVTLGQPDHAVLGSRDTQTVTIADDDSPPSLSFSSTTYSQGEGGGQATITATLSGDTGVTAAIDYATSDGSAEAGSDYTAASGTLTFAPGVTTRTFDVPILNDAEPEGDETVNLSLTGPVSATLGTGNAVLAIMDDDGALPTLSIGDASANEGAGTLTFVVSLSAPSGQEVQVQYATADGTGANGAIAGFDYATRSGTLILPAGASQGQIAVTLLPDTLDEADETFTVALSSPVNASLDDAQATGTILDDDPTPSLSIGDASANEGAGVITFTVSLSAPSGFDVAVDYATAEGAGLSGAQAGLDYLTTSGTFEIPAGSTQGEIPVSLVHDDAFELDETFGVTLNSPLNATLPDDQAAGTIINDDPAPQIGFSSAAYRVPEANGPAVITVTLSGETALTATVAYACSDGTATAGEDYSPASGTLTFPPGTTQQSFSVPILNDTEDEADETVDLALTGATSATLDIDAAVLTIVDDEGAPTLSIGDASAIEGEGMMTFAVQLSFASAFDVSVGYATSDGPSGPGGAMAGADYTGSTGRLTLPAGTTQGSITVTLLPDDLYEGDEVFTVELDSPENAGLTDGIGQGTIVDDDDPPQIGFSSASYDVQENVGGATATITVTLSGATALTATVDYETGDGTAGADDYDAISGTLSFPPGITSRTFEVAIVDDTLDELNETVLLTLTHPSQADLLLDAATLTLVDDDLPPEISIGDANMDEAEGLLTFAVGLSAPSGLEVSVEYATHDGVGPGGATAGADYLHASRVLTIPAGTSSATIQVLILDDDLYEHDETFTVVLSDPVHATLGDVSATGTIRNIDAAPQIGFSQALYEVEEAAGTGVLTVTLSGSTALSATVEYGTGDGPPPAGATAGADYESMGGTLTFLPGETRHTVTVPILNDVLVEGNETFLVTLSGAEQAALGDHGTGIVRILDDEAHGVFLPLVVRSGP